jgi:hypothetical protein
MAPPYVSAVLGRAFAVRWRVFTLHALGSVRDEVAEARRIAERPLVYLALIPSSPRAFTAAERDILASYVRDLLAQDCVSIHHVIDGDGFAASARRSILTNLAVASAHPRAFHTHASLRQALATVAEEIGDTAERLLAEAAKRGIPFPPREGA